MGEFLVVCAAIAYVCMLGCALWLAAWIVRRHTRAELRADGPYITQSTMFPDRWHCAGNGKVGVGSTPNDALANWKKQQ